MIAGLMLGLGAAFCQACSYLAMQHYRHERPDDNRTLLVVGHVWMGIFSLVLWLILWPSPLPTIGVWLEPTFSTAIWYVLGQTSLLYALRKIEPSRISPLLALKLIILAIMTMVLTEQFLSSGQWVAVGMCVLGGIALNYSGKPIPMRAVIATLLACMCYSFSDWNIQRAIKALAPLGAMAAVTSTLLCYGLCGILTALVLPWWGSRQRYVWQAAAPFAVAWFTAMICLAATFASVGVLMGNILQSTRGLMSVMLGWMLVKIGWEHLERRATRGEFVRRLGAATLMMAAVILYAWERQRLASAAPAPATTQAAPR